MDQHGYHASSPEHADARHHNIRRAADLHCTDIWPPQIARQTCFLPPTGERKRLAGGGRKRLSEQDPDLRTALEQLVEGKHDDPYSVDQHGYHASS